MELNNMKIESKYDIGDVVYYADSYYKKLNKITITDISVENNEGNILITYNALQPTGFGFHENSKCVFENKEDAKNYLIEDLKKSLDKQFKEILERMNSVD